jgi:hypothetical protein
MRLLHMELGLPNESFSWVEHSAYPALTQVCRSLRLDNLSFLLSNVVWVELQYLTTFALYFDRRLKNCSVDRRVCCCGNSDQTCRGILPLLALAAEAPRSQITFHSHNECLNEILPSETAELSKLVELSRTNAALQVHLTEAITSVTLHDPQNRRDHEMDCTVFNPVIQT